MFFTEILFYTIFLFFSHWNFYFYGTKFDESYIFLLFALFELEKSYLSFCLWEGIFSAKIFTQFSFSPKVLIFCTNFVLHENLGFFTRFFFHTKLFLVFYTNFILHQNCFKQILFYPKFFDYLHEFFFTPNCFVF